MEDIMSTIILRRDVLVGATVLALLSATARAQGVLKIVYPFPAGNAADATARLIADRMQRDLHRAAIVENRSGAGGRIGARLVKGAAADGTVLLFAVSSQLTLQPHLFLDLGYDPFADFAPVSQVMAFDQAVAVPADSPIRSVRQLVDWYKANPEHAVFGSPGSGTGPHVVALEFAHTFQLKLSHIAYRGTAAALPDLFAGRLPAYFAASAELIEHHIGGKLRILATGGAQRSPLVPDVPTFRESGADIEATGWYGLYVPARTPAQAVRTLEKAITAAVRDSQIRARIEALGFRPTGTTAEELRQIQRAEFDHWAGVVNASGLKASQ
jgi:tripartite-type tricarboxylate transporter receptor subunit TctC